MEGIHSSAASMNAGAMLRRTVLSWNLPTLQADAVRAVKSDEVWACWCPVPREDSELHAEMCSTLLPEEEARAARFALAADRMAFITARGLVRSFLSPILGCRPKGIAFCHNGFGKPELFDPPADIPIHFSISHTRRHVACALAQTPVGIDVEDVDRLMDWAILRELSQKEQAFLESLPLDIRPTQFFRIWTMKEAILKALGTGLSTPLDSFSALPDGPIIEGIRLPPGDTCQQWKVSSKLPTPDVALSVAWTSQADTDRRLCFRD